MLIVREIGCGVYGYYYDNFSVNLKLFQNKKALKKEREGSL